jgi:hypothetical protein
MINMLNRITTVIFNEYHTHTPKGSTTGIGFRPASYWGYEDYFINDVDSKKLINALKIIKNTKPETIKKNSVVYASRASEIPRFKLKEYIKDNNLKKTSIADRADVIIINKGYFETMVNKFNKDIHNFINEDYLMNHTKEIFKNGYNQEDVNINIVSNNKDKHNTAYIDSNRMKGIDWKKLENKQPGCKDFYEKNIHTTEGIVFQTYRENKLVELATLIFSQANDVISGKVKFVFDEELFVELNKEGIELDDEYLQTLRDMLFSKDDANVKLGFEMMSNLVLNQSTLLTISFLLNEMFYTTKFRPSYYTNNNSNLKGLLKLLRTKGIMWERDWKSFGTGLRINFKTGKEGDIVRKFLLDNINREFKLSNSAAEAIVDVVFSTEVK